MIYSGIPRKERRERAERALEKVGLKDRMRHLPNELSGAKTACSHRKSDRQ